MGSFCHTRAYTSCQSSEPWGHTEGFTLPGPPTPTSGGACLRFLSCREKGFRGPFISPVDGEVEFEGGVPHMLLYPCYPINVFPVFFACEAARWSICFRLSCFARLMPPFLASRSFVPALRLCVRLGGPAWAEFLASVSSFLCLVFACSTHGCCFGHRRECLRSAPTPFLSESAWFIPRMPLFVK